MKRQKLMLGDNLSLLKSIPSNSIDSVVTDPPYGLSFMGKKWDYDVPSVEFWKEVYRVLKPGGHILSFGGTRTYHRLAVAIEDAGFEIRDQIQWLYGSGFPKSLNIGKAVDKLEGNEREVVGENKYASKLPNPMNGQTYIMNKSGWDCSKNLMDTKGQSEWEGWGSALKPANEPICLARKPLSEKSIAENVLKWRTGGLNIDGCRVGFMNEKIDFDKKNARSGGRSPNFNFGINKNETTMLEYNTECRFPANIILDEIAAEMLDEQSGFSKSIKLPLKSFDTKDTFKKTNKTIRMNNYDDNGGASRFFYQAKVSKAERNMGLDEFEDKKIDGLVKPNNKCRICGFWENKGAGNGIDFCMCKEPNFENRTFIHKVKNNHPTIKPVALMTYLCRLITPPNGIVLDPFMGSGSTGISALLEGFRFVGMEMEPEYFKIAEARINSYEDYRKFIKYDKDYKK